MSQNRKFDIVPAIKIHSSSVLPSRKHGSEVAESVRSVGVQQPLIVRPLPDNPGEFELIDGHARLSCFKGEELVPVEVRLDVTKNSDVFRISEATFRREERTAFERGQFYAKWIEAFRAERGIQVGLQAILAQEAGLSEAAVSQYLAISELFSKFAERDTAEFSALKNLSMAKLYKLSEISENPALLETARHLEERPEVSLEELTMVVDQVKLAVLEPQMSSNDTQANQAVPMNSNSSKDWSRSTKQIETLLAETNEALTKIANEVTDNAERFSSNDARRLFGKILSTLRRLKKYSIALHEAVQPKTSDNTVQTT